MRSSHKTIKKYKNKDIEIELGLKKYMMIMMKTKIQIQASVTEIMAHEYRVNGLHWRHN